MLHYETCSIYAGPQIPCCGQIGWPLASPTWSPDSLLLPERRRAHRSWSRHSETCSIYAFCGQKAPSLSTLQLVPPLTHLQRLNPFAWVAHGGFQPLAGPRPPTLSLNSSATSDHPPSPLIVMPHQALRSLFLRSKATGTNYIAGRTFRIPKGCVLGKVELAMADTVACEGSLDKVWVNFLNLLLVWREGGQRMTPLVVGGGREAHDVPWTPGSSLQSWAMLCCNNGRSRWNTPRKKSTVFFPFLLFPKESVNKTSFHVIIYTLHIIGWPIKAL